PQRCELFHYFGKLLGNVVLLPTILGLEVEQRLSVLGGCRRGDEEPFIGPQGPSLRLGSHAHERTECALFQAHERPSAAAVGVRQVSERESIEQRGEQI